MTPTPNPIAEVVVESNGVRIDSLRAREVLDARGFPTIEVDVTTSGGALGRAQAPSGLSRAAAEAFELRDARSERHNGHGVQSAVRNVTRHVAPLLEKQDASNQAAIDAALMELDGTTKKSDLGGNTLLAVSIAVAKAVAAARGVPLYRALPGSDSPSLPLPMFNLISGGTHADNNLDFQEFMILPLAAPTFSDAVRVGAEVYQSLKSILKESGTSTAVGDTGGFAPNLRANVHALELLVAAIERAGLTPGRDVGLALDAAATTLYHHANRGYEFTYSPRRTYSSAELVASYEDWVRQFPIVSIEDGLAEDDWDGWQLLSERLGSRVQLVGDDLFATRASTLRRGVERGVANAVLIKLNQVGTLTEALETMHVARSNGYATIVSGRAGETEDDFIADLAVATRAPQIKAGAPCRGERVTKYNRLLRIEEELGRSAEYAGRAGFSVGR
ncbi:MAG TPA: phosphopyruvate hydratase [Polyangiaceae bacterium]|nr:phosphopyruvate hydratase [Polyangiaceae bacterium]